MRLIAIGMLAVALAGCGGGINVQQELSRQDEAKCRSYGVPKGSQPYVQCRMMLEQNRAVADASAQQSGAMMAVGYGLMNSR